MLKRRIIPCLDIKDGRVVKGINFEGLLDAGDPVEAARRYDQEGADELAFLDITASHQNRSTLLHVVEATAQCVFMPLTVGGGVSEVGHVSDLLHAGADKVSINSGAVKNPSLLTEAAERFGCQCVVLAIDAKRSEDPQFPSGYQVYTHGGRQGTHWDALVWAQEGVKRGAGEILLTSMDRDGTRQGFDVELTARIAQHVSVPVIASGGVGSLEHLLQGFVDGHADAVLAASIFHFRQHTIQEARDYLQAHGVPMRRL